MCNSYFLHFIVRLLCLSQKTHFRNLNYCLPNSVSFYYCPNPYEKDASELNECTYVLKSCNFINIQGIHKRMVRFQKLVTNLFLILHGHNIHHQQWQLSKFLIRYQQFASHAYCMLRFEVSRSVITVQREFHARFPKDTPHRQVVPTVCRNWMLA
jgi:hypothetical protein